MLRSRYFNLLLALGFGLSLNAAAQPGLKASEAEDIARSKKAQADGEKALADAKKRREDTRKSESFQGFTNAIDVLKNQPLDKRDNITRSKIHSTFMGEPDPRDFNVEKFEPWSLNASDFVYDKPRLVLFQDGDSIVQPYVALSYTITNSTTRTLRIKPNFTMLAGHYYTKPLKDESYEFRYLNNYRSFVQAIPAVDGVPPIGQTDFEKLADTRLEKLMGWSQYSLLTADLHKIMTHYQLARDLKGDPANGNNWDIKAYDYKPGEVKHGVALFPLENPSLETMRILVSGLTNHHFLSNATHDQLYTELQDPNYAMYNVPLSAPHTMRRVLDLRFKRSDQTGFTFDKTTFDFIAQRWEKIWDPLGDMEILSDLPKPVEMDGFFEGAQKHPLWHVKWKLTNTTDRAQQIRIDKMFYNVKVSFTFKNEPMSFWVRVVDDGNLSIFKDQYLKDHADLAGGEDKTWFDRYRFLPLKNDEVNKQERQFRDLIELQPVSPETRGQDLPAQTRTSVSIFDAHDIDWDDVFLKVTCRLSRKIDPEKESEKMIGNAMRNFDNSKNLKGQELAKELVGKGLLLYNPKFTFAGMDGADPAADTEELKKIVFKAVVDAMQAAASPAKDTDKKINLSISTVQMGPKNPDRFEGMKNADPLGPFIGDGVKQRVFYLRKRDNRDDLKAAFTDRDKADPTGQ